MSTINEACVLCRALFDLTPVAPSPTLSDAARLSLSSSSLSSISSPFPSSPQPPALHPSEYQGRLKIRSLSLRVSQTFRCASRSLLKILWDGSIGQGMRSSLPESSGSCSLHHLRPGGGGKPQGRSLRGIQCAQTPRVTPRICRSRVLLLTALRSRRSSLQMHSVLHAAQAAQMRFWSSMARGLCRKRSTLAASSSILTLQRVARCAVQRVVDAYAVRQWHCSGWHDAYTAGSGTAALARCTVQRCSECQRQHSYARHAALRVVSLACCQHRSTCRFTIEQLLLRYDLCSQMPDCSASGE